MSMEYGGYGRPAPDELYRMRKQAEQGLGRDSAINAGTLGLNVAGTALQGFGAYQAYQDAERQREEERRRYAEEQRIQAIRRQQDEEQRKMGNNLTHGGYAQGIANNRNQEYGGFARRVGL